MSFNLLRRACVGKRLSGAIQRRGHARPPSGGPLSAGAAVGCRGALPRKLYGLLARRIALSLLAQLFCRFIPPFGPVLLHPIMHLRADWRGGNVNARTLNPPEASLHVRAA